MAFSDAPCFRPTEQAVSAILSKISSISYSLVAPILTRVGNPEWSLSEMEIWKKDKDYFGFPARFKIGATKESWRDLDKIADTNVMTKGL